MFSRDSSLDALGANIAIDKMLGVDGDVSRSFPTACIILI